MHLPTPPMTKSCPPTIEKLSTNEYNNFKAKQTIFIERRHRRQVVFVWNQNWAILKIQFRFSKKIWPEFFD